MKRAIKVQRRQMAWPTFLCTDHMCHCFLDPPGQIFVMSASKSPLVRGGGIKGGMCALEVKPEPPVEVSPRVSLTNS